MGSAGGFTLPAGPASAGPQPNFARSAQLTITIGGELEDGRAFFGNDAVRAFDSP
jgi:hypothetical protein